MKNWRQILSWRQAPREPRIGDRVKFIATWEDSVIMGLDFIHYKIYGMEGTVVDVSSHTVNFYIYDNDYLIPLSDWEKYLEIVN
jgi:hypothetical protein